MVRRLESLVGLVDFVEAFDHVDHNVLVSKMIGMGVPVVIIRWICAFPQHRRQCLKIEDSVSDWSLLVAVMPQGSYFGPLTFFILMDSLQPDP